MVWGLGFSSSGSKDFGLRVSGLGFSVMCRLHRGWKGYKGCILIPG